MIYENVFLFLEQIAPSLRRTRVHSARIFADVRRREMASEIPEIIYALGPQPNAFMFMTPVHYAAQNGYPNIVRLLEQHGADINAVTDCGRSVFMLAEENGHKYVLVYCINESSLSTPKEKQVQSLSQSREFV